MNSDNNERSQGLQEKKQAEEAKQATEPEVGKAQIWGLSEREFKITVNCILRALMEKSRQHAGTCGSCK